MSKSLFLVAACAVLTSFIINNDRCFASKSASRPADVLLSRVQMLVADLARLSTTYSPKGLLFAQHRMVRDGVLRARSVGDVSYLLVGKNVREASGDFIDLSSLNDGKQIIRFGDVMGHGWFAARTAFTLQKTMRNSTIASLLAGVYQAEGGIKTATGVLETLTADISTPTFGYYTMTSSIIDPEKRTITTLFAGSQPFYLIRKTDGGVEVHEVYDEKASMPFVTLDAKLMAVMPRSSVVRPLRVDYRPDDVLVYISDGLTGREVDAETHTELWASPELKEVLAECYETCEDVSFAKNFAEILNKKIQDVSKEIMPDDVSILAIRLR